MDILGELNAIAREYRGDDVTIKADDNFTDLGFDSLDRVELVMAIEEKFGITFPDDIKIETVSELIEKIEALIK